MLMNCGVGEDSWESLGPQVDPTSQSSGKSFLNIHWKDWCRSWNSNTLATWFEELTHWKRTWFWERLKAGGEGDDRGWDGWMASPTQWTWIWASSRRWWWTGKPDRAVDHGVLKSWTWLSGWPEMMLANHPYVVLDALSTPSRKTITCAGLFLPVFTILVPQQFYFPGKTISLGQGRYFLWGYKPILSLCVCVCVCVCVLCVYLLSHVWLFVIPWTVASQAPISMEFFRQ